MENTMIYTVTTLLDEGKKSLDVLLREKAYTEVVEILAKEGISIEEVADADIEALVAAKIGDKINAIKGFAVGSLFALLLSAVIGV